jgi:hypothetical protein
MHLAAARTSLARPDAPLPTDRIKLARDRITAARDDITAARDGMKIGADRA